MYVHVKVFIHVYTKALHCVYIYGSELISMASSLSLMDSIVCLDSWVPIYTPMYTHIHMYIYTCTVFIHVHVHASKDGMYW